MFIHFVIGLPVTYGVVRRKMQMFLIHMVWPFYKTEDAKGARFYQLQIAKAGTLLTPSSIGLTLNSRHDNNLVLPKNSKDCFPGCYRQLLAFGEQGDIQLSTGAASMLCALSRFTFWTMCCCTLIEQNLFRKEF